MELLSQMTINDWVLLTIIVSVWTSVSTVVIANNYKKWFELAGPGAVILVIVFIICSLVGLKGLVLLLVD